MGDLVYTEVHHNAGQPRGRRRIADAELYDLMIDEYDYIVEAVNEALSLNTDDGTLFPSYQAAPTSVYIDEHNENHEDSDE